MLLARKLLVISCEWCIIADSCNCLQDCQLADICCHRRVLASHRPSCQRLHRENRLQWSSAWWEIPYLCRLVLAFWDLTENLPTASTQSTWNTIKDLTSSTYPVTGSSEWHLSWAKDLFRLDVFPHEKISFLVFSVIEPRLAREGTAT